MGTATKKARARFEPVSGVRPPIATDYEVKIWRRGTGDWCWKVRYIFGYSQGNGRIVGDGSRCSSRATAKATARKAVLGDEAARKAKWKPLDF